MKPIENRQAAKIRFWATGEGRACEWWKFEEIDEGGAREVRAKSSKNEARAKVFETWMSQSLSGRLIFEVSVQQLHELEK